MGKVLSWFFLAAIPVCGPAQTVGQNSQVGNEAIPNFSVRSQIVTETVTVKDKTGKDIAGLTARDFTLTEDGVTQKIRFVEHQSLPSATTPLPPLNDDHDVTIYKTLNRSKITPEHDEMVRYKDHRLIALYFDMSAMQRADQYRALRAADIFVRKLMTAADLVSILRFTNGSVDVLQDFTADRSRLLSVLSTMTVGENQEWAADQSDASAADTGAAFGQDDSEFNIFNTDRQLAALQTATNMLGHLNEKKVLVYFAGSLRLNGIDNEAQLHATVDAAVRAGVSFWPIDARGLVAEAPLGNATRASPGSEAMYSGTAEEAVQADFAQSQDTLYSLATDTGGKALLDTNDLTQGITQAQKAITDYYVLSYYTTNTALDGRFRRIKIAVKTSEVLKLDYRRGYYAAKEFRKFSGADKERQLEDALMLEDPITDLTIALELDYFQLNRAEYFVPLTVKIPGRELALAKHEGADHVLVDFIGEVKDIHDGTTVSNVRDNINIKFTDQTEAQLAHAPIEYMAGFTLLPGRYKIKLLARDDDTGRIGTFETAFTIPDLNREEQHVPISSVVLSAQRTDLKDAVYHSMKRTDEVKGAAVNPLVVDGSKLIPSVTRIFSRGRIMYVYLQGYESGTEIAKPLIAYVSFYRDGARQFTSKPLAITPKPSRTLKSVPLAFNLDLNNLGSGTYDCQVSVLDPTTGKSTFWRAPVKITQ